MPVLTTYPDILGAITGGTRANIGVLQVAAALRPRVIMAGRSVEMLLLVQNASDADLQVTAALRLPPMDAKKQKDRFVTKADSLAFKVAAGAVGLVVLPMSTLPDIAIGADYRIGMELKVTVSGSNPTRIRAAGGAPLSDAALSDSLRQTIEPLKKLIWSGNLSGSVIDTGLTIMSGKVGTFADLQPSWSSLWTPTDDPDHSYLLDILAPVMWNGLLPQLKRAQILPVMREYTEKRFASVGYDLSDEELHTITRYLTAIVELASPPERDIRTALASEKFSNLRQYYSAEGTFVLQASAVRVPRWLVETARVFLADSRATQFPLKAIGHFAYDALLRDALAYGFEQVENRLDVQVGTLEQREAYMDHVLQALNDNTLTFDLLYMPLMLGAIVSIETVLVRNERPRDVVLPMRRMLEQRLKEQTDETRPVFAMANRLLADVTMRYNMSE